MTRPTPRQTARTSTPGDTPRTRWDRRTRRAQASYLARARSQFDRPTPRTEGRRSA